MKSRNLLLLAGITLVGGNVSVRAQDAVTPQQAQQLVQNLVERFQERFNNASPEEQAQLTQLRAQFENQIRQRGIDINDPASIASALQQGGAMEFIQGQVAGRAGRGGNAAGGWGGNAAGGRGGRGGNAAAGWGGNAAGGRAGRGGNLAVTPMTPEERNGQRRQMMINAGITDTNIQDDIIVFLTAEDKAREPLIRLARAAAATLDPRPLRIAVLSNLLPENEKKVEDAFNVYQEALAADKVRHEAALKSLDASIGYMNNPRLKAFLTLVGITDNDVLALGGATAIFGATPAVPNLPRANPIATGGAARQARNANGIDTPAEGAAAPVQTNPFLQP